MPESPLEIISYRMIQCYSSYSNFPKRLHILGTWISCWCGSLQYLKTNSQKNPQPDFISWNSQLS